MPDSPRSRDDPDRTDDADALGRRGDSRDDGVRTDEGRQGELPPSDGAEAERPPLEPGSPSAENVFFVLVGVVLTLLLLLSVFVPLPLVA